MKIRHGFVSNSSSSSFILVVSLTDHSYAMNSLSDEDMVLMSEVLCGIEPQMVGKEQVIVIDEKKEDDYHRIGSLNIDDYCQDHEPKTDWYNFDTSFWQNYLQALPKDRTVQESEYR